MRIRAWILAAAATAAVQGAEAPAPPLDPDIQKIVSGISIERIQRSVVVLASFKTRHTLSDPAPSGDGIGGAGSWVRAEFERVSAATGGRLEVTLDEFDQGAEPPRIPRPVHMVNILATLPCPGPGAPVYILGAHYDSRAGDPLDADSPAPGADDNASGVAAVLETARALAPYSYNATLVFAAFAGGEQNHNGAARLAERARREGRTILGMFDDDTIGNPRAEDGMIDRSTIRLFAEGVPPLEHPDSRLLSLIGAGGENDTPPRELARAIRDIAALYVPSMNVRIIYRGDRYARSGDHMAFLNRGFPAVRFAEPEEDPRHLRQNVRTEDGVDYGDTTAYFDSSYTADVARVNAAALASLARAPEPPRAVEIETAGPGDSATLVWSPSPGAPAAGYRIVWRETTAPFWQHEVDAPGDATRFKVEGVRRDDAVFGVEAFDAAGHVSPAVFPFPRPSPW